MKELFKRIKQIRKYNKDYIINYRKNIYTRNGE